MSIEYNYDEEDRNWMYQDEIRQKLQSIEATRNGYGARIRVNRREPWIVANRDSDVLWCCPDKREDHGTFYILPIYHWNQYYQEHVTLIRDEDWNSLGQVEHVEILPGYDVDGLDRDYGINGEWDGPWAPPQFYKRRPGQPKKIRKVTGRSGE